MNTPIIIVIIFFIIVFIIKKNNNVEKNKSAALGMFDKMYNDVFPNGRKDIAEGAKYLRDLLNRDIDNKTADTIFVKSTYICYLVTNKNLGFSKDRLREHLEPYALKYFNETSLDLFYKYLVSRNKKAKAWNDLLEMLASDSDPASRKGTDQDMMPEGYGKFGLEVTNPIPASSVPDIYEYLNRLRTSVGSEVSYARIGGFQAPNINDTIDAYKIYVDGVENTTIYFCAYNQKTSSMAPEGFILT